MENKTENRFCLQCQIETPHFHNQGVSKKNGKPYENYKCADCGETEWVNSDQPKAVKPYRPIKLKSDEPDWDKIRAEKNENIAFLNSKNNTALLLAAAIKAGWYNTLDEALQDYEKVCQKIYDLGRNE